MSVRHQSPYLASIWLCAIVTLTVGMPKAPATAHSDLSPPEWPLWSAYKSHFIQADGRVIEHSQRSRTTSEAQAYALFHALVADDPDTFKRVLHWTENNLADGSLKNQLPAWLWGQRADNSWGVLDDNSASDADMWLAYTLLEAADHWHNRTYRKLGKTLLRHIESNEIVLLPGAGAMVLPGPRGFALVDDHWKLNPSYLPPQLLLRFSAVGDRAIWESVFRQTVAMLEQVEQQGTIPDWVTYSPETGYDADGEGPEYQYSSYDAIRVHLWIGMLAEDSPQRDRLLKAITSGCERTEKTSISALKQEERPSPGLIAARLPYYRSTKADSCLAAATASLKSSWNKNLLGNAPVYYDQNLALFAMGWMEQRFRFLADGQLSLRGKTKNVSYWKK